MVGGTPPPPDKTKPTSAPLSFSRTAFAAAKSGSAFSSQKDGKAQGEPPVGTKVSFNLSEAAAVQVHSPAQDHRPQGLGQVQDAHAQEPQEGQVHAVEERPRVVHVHRQGRQKNSFTFRGRIGGRTLRTGGYRLNGTATDPAKNASTPKNKTFRIVK